MPKADITKQDLYGILEVAENATSKEIIKAYRRKALKCHPDKNPDNPKAAELFHQLSEALEVLTDVPARAAYDNIIKAKKAAALRHKELDAKRKKFKEDLEARERAAEERKLSDTHAEKNLEAEIERLRKEGSALLKAEQNYVNQQVKTNTTEPGDEDTKKPDHKTPKLKLKWKAKKGDPSNGGYSAESLENIFSKYGDVLNVLVSSKRTGSAIVELRDPHAAVLAVQTEIGLSENPVTVTWLEGQPEASPRAPGPQPGLNTPGPQPGLNTPRPQPGLNTPGPQPGLNTPRHQPGVNGFSSGDLPGTFTAIPCPPPSERDFESLVLRKLRQAEERKRLAEEIAKEDAEDDT